MEKSRRAFRACLALATLSLIGNPLTAVPAVAAQAGKTYQNWTIGCQEGGDASEQCFIFQDRVLREGGQRVLRVTVAYPPTQTDPVALLTLPLGILLPHGLKVQVDEQPAMQVPFLRCEPNGCTAAIKLEPSLLEIFSAGAQAKITFHDFASRQPVTLPLSLNGFGPGLAALK